MEPEIIQRFLSLVEKSSFREYLAASPGESLSKALEAKLKWAQENTDETRQQEAEYLLQYRAALRATVATMPMEEDEEWIEFSSPGEEFGGSKLSNPYMAFNMLDDDDDDDEESAELDEKDTLTPDEEETIRIQFEEDVSDEPTPLPGTIGFSESASTEQPAATRSDGPQIGEEAAYRNVSERASSSYEVATAEQALAPEPGQRPSVRSTRSQTAQDGRHIISGCGPTNASRGSNYPKRQ